MSEQAYLWLADLILFVHVGFVLFIVGGLVAIYMGAALGWAFVRHRRFRLLHLGAIAFVLLETLIGMVCPLTEWEAQLRARAGEHPYADTTFMQYWLHQLLYKEWPEQIFLALYATTFLLITTAWWLIPCSDPFQAREF